MKLGHIVLALALLPMSWAQDKMPIEEATLTYAPNVPPAIKRDHPARVQVKMTTIEKVARLADGVEYTFWTFGGAVPGPMIRVREGDIIDFMLSNHPDSKMPHNIDLHAATGPGGGAAASLTAPGHTSKFSFKVINPGLYVYHCATAPVGMHVANGMYGLILVEPKFGLPPVDREFYIMQSEFYTVGRNGERGLQPLSMEKAIDERPDYVVFNGSVGALMGDNAIEAKTGEKIRMFLGNGGPNLISSFHVIGEIFDDVYGEGGTMISQKNVQTTLIPAGGSAMVTFRTEVPGNYVLVDHSITRAFNKGAVGILKVEGNPDLEIYSGKISDTVYHPEGGTIQSMPLGKAPEKVALSPAKVLEHGKEIYETSCQACHQAGGKGIPGVFPPLAKSDYLMADLNRAIRAVTNGLSGEIVVNGVKYNSVMPVLHLSDEDVAAVMSYVRQNFGNDAKDMVTVEQVVKAKSE